MTRPEMLTASFLSRLLAPPSEDREIAMHCTLAPDEIVSVARKRTTAARLGYAYAESLTYLRDPGRVQNVGEQPIDVMLDFSQCASKLEKPTSTKLSKTRNPTKVADVPVIYARAGQ